jgi:hypothetical protein
LPSAFVGNNIRQRRSVVLPADLSKQNMVEKNESQPIPLLRQAAQWIATLGLVIGSFSALALIIYVFWSDPKAFTAILVAQVRAVVGIPMAAVSAFCVVWVLEATSGSIEFEIGPMKFRGASGPVVLWVFAFIAFVMAINLLWQ